MPTQVSYAYLLGCFAAIVTKKKHTLIGL